MITSSLIKRETGQYDVEVITRLRLERMGISSISNLEFCISLVELSLAYNDIVVIKNLDALVSLKRLDLSYNKITRIDGLDHVMCLEWLDLRGNAIDDVNNLIDLSPLQSLKSISFKGIDGDDSNPVCSHNNYYDMITRTLPSLTILDGGHIEIIKESDNLKKYADKSKSEESQENEPPILDRWYNIKDMELDIDNDVDALTSLSSSIFNNANAACNKASEMLTEDCSMLLRKATNVYSKATTK
jgi:Leucine-rich repeat (LRR) protein